MAVVVTQLTLDGLDFLQGLSHLVLDGGQFLHGALRVRENPLQALDQGFLRREAGLEINVLLGDVVGGKRLSDELAELPELGQRGVEPFGRNPDGDAGVNLPILHFLGFAAGDESFLLGEDPGDRGVRVVVGLDPKAHVCVADDLAAFLVDVLGAVHHRRLTLIRRRERGDLGFEELVEFRGCFGGFRFRLHSNWRRNLDGIRRATVERYSVGNYVHFSAESEYRGGAESS